MASLAANGISWYLAPTGASTDSPAAFLATSDVAAQCYASTGEYAYLAELTRAAERLLSRRSKRALINRTYDLVLDRFPSDDYPLELPLPPLVSVSSITYYDTNNSTQAMASTDYVSHRSQHGISYLMPQPDATWPTCKTRRDAVTVRFVAGYGTASTDVPETIRQAGKMTVAHWYRNREAAAERNITQIDLGLDSLLAAEGWGFYP